MSELKPIKLRPYVVGILLAWTFFVSVVFVWNIFHHYAELEDVTLENAKQIYEKDLLYRRWVSRHGGVYVPISEQSPPNPYLSHIEHRDLTTLDGKKMTLVNPTYMTRQVHDLNGGQHGAQGHLTSLNPVNSENEPDEWERQALVALSNGFEEFSGIEEMDGGKHLRLMRPMVVEDSCLECHGDQGYQAGDVRGGISVSVPIDQLIASANRHLVSIGAAHVFLWLFGVVGVGFGAKRFGLNMQERERVQDLLRQEKEISQYYLDTAAVMMVALDTDGKVTMINKKGCKVLGYREEEVLGKNWFDNFLPEAERQKVKTLFEKLLSGELKEIDYHENEILAKDGEKRTAAWHNSYFRDELGCIVGVLSSGEDITDQRTTLEALKESEKGYRALAQNIPAIVYRVLFEHGNEMIFFNDMLEQMTGYTEDTLRVGSSCSVVSHIIAEDGQKVAAAVYEAYRDKNFYKVEYRFHHCDGQVRWFSEIGRPIFDSDGGLTHVDGVIFDVTERNQAREKLRQHQSQISHASRLNAIGQMASELAHEINQPLSTIIMQAGLGIRKMDSPDTDPEQIRQLLGKIEKHADMAGRIVSGIKDFSRKQMPRLKVVDINEVINEAISFAEIEAERKGCKIRTSLSDEPIFVKADKIQVEQVILNLVNNAIDSMLKNEPENRQILIRADGQADEMAVVSVVDQGGGISPEVKQKLFEPFFSTKPAGLGIGLSISRSIIEANGGRLWAEAKDVQGTEFKFSLPLAEKNIDSVSRLCYNN